MVVYKTLTKIRIYFILFFLKECENAHKEINIKPYVLIYPVEEMDQANQTVFS